MLNLKIPQKSTRLSPSLTHLQRCSTNGHSFAAIKSTVEALAVVCNHTSSIFGHPLLKVVQNIYCDDTLITFILFCLMKVITASPKCCNHKYFSCLIVITASPKCCNHKYFSCLMVITASSKPCNKDSEQIWAVHIQISSWWDTFIVAADLSPCPCSWIHNDSVSSEVLVIALTSIKLICSQRCWLKFCWLQVNVTIGLLRIIISSGNAFIMSWVNPKRAFIEQLKYNPCWEFV